ncbi:hypothetical protein CO115_00205 [Candidatus Falkowbacteria bacterium CG_4_9_14_3_um_filter_36_9]|uniref:DUF8173 domain-containing protein n=2 Tax=Candidatus Falkowiibacteriota TaxID=1752728 RepID=A0A1J4T6R8_9BACT|nr:MAG: hypothetical protein AUJ27_02390 [Candidatus Falkowbacteria bacterium CG1_02_37_44]PIV52084.1 MAG: hypothetical protein COS18_00590 [Candidatus Falkowbacteria bacterium CG02_land_8_20_14_3_00_36_14]PIX12338.1 MAG: hypothetical protein COZ73_00370 [Candidatus Falkowbacteria bacterium CG_4_8_14_3_um_filter_36_11]PJA10971.1 MAG: hypothetical protein COX67_02260 [Candidatus Falkowbacteria bacterium CG_4_10_14_0_2_um_filter_36_22]PJB20828.1 MAG: hypothetical protein CO115_00205 [Candidatus F
MKKTLIVFFALFLFMPLVASAFAVKTSDSVYIGKNDTVAGNLYTAGANITVEGKVTGDVICAGQSVNINGAVEGDVICAGQSVNINGAVGGSVRAAGNSVNINGQVARNIMIAGASVILGSDAQAGWDMLIAGAVGEIRGKVGRDLYGVAASMIISGEVNGDVRLKIDDKIESKRRGVGLNDNKTKLKIEDTAKINGGLIYTAEGKAQISSSTSIVGKVTHNLPKLKNTKKLALMGLVWVRTYSIFSSLIIGLVLISFWRGRIKDLTDVMQVKAGASIGWGIAVMFLTPVILILLLLTIIGIPLALMLLGIWLIFICVSKILTGILAGRIILEKFWKQKKDNLILAMIIGIVALWIIFSIPFVGWILFLIATWWGLGGIFIYLKKA